MWFWGTGFIVFMGLLWLLQDVLLPFILGMAVAYFLDPLVDRCENRGMARWLGTSVVLLSFFAVFVGAMLLLIPVMQGQVVNLLHAVPGYIEDMRTAVLPLIERYYPSDTESVTQLREAASGYAGTAFTWLAGVAQKLWSGGSALFDIISVLIITPVVAFYMLRDWDIMTNRIDGWLPRKHSATIRELFHQIDETLAGFVRGQASVCLMLGIFYAIALTIAGLSFGLVIGLGAGILSFIPYVGSMLGFVVGVGVAIFQFGDWFHPAIIAGIFMFGQVIEGNVLTPKLVGESVGLHAVWIMFALMAGGALFGFVGVMIGVPVAAVIGVMTRFALERYLESSFYTGEVAVAGGAKTKPAKKSAAQKKKPAEK